VLLEFVVQDVDMRLIAGQSVESVGEHDVDGAGSYELAERGKLGPLVETGTGMHVGKGPDDDVAMRGGVGQTALSLGLE
jgi:hypothetical protein